MKIKKETQIRWVATALILVLIGQGSNLAITLGFVCVFVSLEIIGKVVNDMLHDMFLMIRKMDKLAGENLGDDLQSKKSED